MGYFDGPAASLFRETTDGHRVYVPLGKWGKIYELTPEGELSVARQWRWFYASMFGAVLVLGTLLSWHLPSLLVFAILAGGLSIPFALWTARHLRLAPISSSALVPITRAERVTRHALATGGRVIKITFILSLIMTILAIILSVLAPDPGLWWGAVFFGVCAGILGWQLHLLRNRRLE